MADAILVGGGGGGVHSDDVTAAKAQVLSGYNTVTSDSNDEVVSGTMVNRGTINQTIGINGSYTIPQGYHSGSGRVSQSLTTKGAATYYPKASSQTIGANQWLSGVQTISAISQTNLSAANIKKGVTISISNGNGNVWSVTGTWEGYIPETTDLYYRGTYGQYGTLDFYTAPTSPTCVSLDSGQVTFNTGQLNTEYLRVAFVTPVAINMASYTSLYLEGSLSLGSS